jgi:FtsH-binding integral membrane protein
MIYRDLKILIRILMAACLALGLAICCSLGSQRQTMQDAIVTPSVMSVTAVCGITLFFLSLFCLKQLRRLPFMD